MLLRDREDSECDMKKLVTTALIAASFVSPALAGPHRTVSPQAAAAQASAPYSADAYSVTVNGQTIGRDPDANVRLMLTRDPQTFAS